MPGKKKSWVYVAENKKIPDPFNTDHFVSVPEFTAKYFPGEGTVFYLKDIFVYNFNIKVIIFQK